MTRRKDLLLVIATFVVAPLAASATPITVPTDLNLGDTYRLAFVTFGTRNATDVLIGPYNDFVTTAAAGVPELAALGTTWKAIGSTALTDARDNTGTNPTVSTGVPIYRLDDTRIANNNADLWDGEILNPLNVYQTGVEAGGATQVWTGTGTTGQEAGSWGIGSANVGVGAGDQTDDDWVANGAAGNPSHRAWYAVSGVLTVVPELNPGDFNGDLIVDGADFLEWQREDGTADSLLEWETNYGNDYALAAVTAAVPEPSSFALIAVGLLGMGYRRQKQA